MKDGTAEPGVLLILRLDESSVFATRPGHVADRLNRIAISSLASCKLPGSSIEQNGVPKKDSQDF